MSSQDRSELISALYAEGVPVKEIAGRAGVCVKTVRNVARRAGLPPRHAPNPERDARVAASYAAGLPIEEIASAHGVSRSRVRVVAERAGIPPRVNWQRRYPLDESVFDSPSPVGWWLIGLLAADGSVDAATNRISLCQSLKDGDVLRAFYEHVGCPDRPLTLLNLSDAARARQLPRSPAAEARIFSRRMVTALERHGIVPRKTGSMRLGWEACRVPAVWLGLLDGDGSVGVYRGGRAPRILFSGTEAVMRQCERFWREALDIATERPAARPHSKGIWIFSLGGAKATAAARILLGASPVSMARKRALLADVAGRTG